jgi:3-hydroxyacyl-CoA dehydrogenase
MDKLLAKDVAKGKITSEEAKEARDRVTVVPEDVGLKGLRDVDLVVEVGHFLHSFYSIGMIFWPHFFWA